MYLIPRSNFIINILNQCFKLVDAGLNTVQLHISTKYRPIVEPPRYTSTVSHTIELCLNDINYQNVYDFLDFCLSFVTIKNVYNIF